MEDNSCFLLDFSFKGKNYLLLYDKLQDAGFLGLSLAEARGIIQSLKEEMGDRLPEIFKL